MRFGRCHILLINRKSSVEREGARVNPKSRKVCLLCSHICKASGQLQLWLEAHLVNMIKDGRKNKSAIG